MLDPSRCRQTLIFLLLTCHVGICHVGSLDFNKRVPHSLLHSLLHPISSSTPLRLRKLVANRLQAPDVASSDLGTHGPEPYRKLGMQLGTHGPEPSRAPDAAGPCQKQCQTECQNICQIECQMAWQNICLIKCQFNARWNVKIYA